MIDIELNGQPHAVAAHATVAEMLETLHLQGQALAVAIDRQIIPRSRWAETTLMPGARVELVRAIGGG